ncbi:hypothetical protein CesoFtcFv8_005180 [Champsocephalus esox]|uniref:Uncharacterized protein n=1 Tax=Champsocephalus esox TaxID=159716 RepID=A0AAN8HCB5_9TELE|nr:hypothetical protein CesoFtcFv8_005180 [Champsocephalus esox]
MAARHLLKQMQGGGISLASVSRTEELSLGRNHIPGCLPGASSAWPVQRSLGSQEQRGAQMLLPSALTS